MWMLPREDWGEYENAAPVDHLDLAASSRAGAASGTAGRLVPARPRDRRPMTAATP